MANVSDLITEFIMSTFGDDLILQLSRNELASYFSCAPSQINYVLSTRFTPDKGYLIESKRGGGGNITIIRLEEDKSELLAAITMELDNVEYLSENKAVAILTRLNRDEIISGESCRLLCACLSDRVLNSDGDGHILRNKILLAAIQELMKDG